MDDKEIDRENEQFNEGVFHAVDLLAKALGVTDYVGQDGSEDYDTDLSNTMLNILAAKGIYDADECQFPACAVPVDQWKIVVNEPVLIYVVHANAAFEKDEKRRKEMWEGWTSGKWIKNGEHASGWTYYGMCGKVTHVAPLPMSPAND